MQPARVVSQAYFDATLQVALGSTLQHLRGAMRAVQYAQRAYGGYDFGAGPVGLGHGDH